MPTYEYRCRACGHEFERFQKISDRPVRTCPECGKRKVERLISAGGGLVFKGPGFYATDYRKGGPSDGGESGDAAGGEKAASGGRSASGEKEKGGSGGKKSGSGGGKDAGATGSG